MFPLDEYDLTLETESTRARQQLLALLDLRTRSTDPTSLRHVLSRLSAFGLWAFADAADTAGATLAGLAGEAGQSGALGEAVAAFADAARAEFSARIGEDALLEVIRMCEQVEEYVHTADRDDAAKTASVQEGFRYWLGALDLHEVDALAGLLVAAYLTAFRQSDAPDPVGGPPVGGRCAEITAGYRSFAAAACAQQAHLRAGTSSSVGMAPPTRTVHVDRLT